MEQTDAMRLIGGRMTKYNSCLDFQNDEQHTLAEVSIAEMFSVVELRAVVVG
jgi:hypothetical protein